MDNPLAADPSWVARCAHRLRRQWPHADPTSLDEAAHEIWLDPRLRGLTPEQAAECWLEPLRLDPMRLDAPVERRRTA